MLKKINKKFLSTAFTLTGTIIGAGILGLPHVISESGFFIGLFWIFFLGIIAGYCYLCLGEVALRTKSIHQLPGYAKKYLGNNLSMVMLFATIFGIYSALLAYLIGEGQSLSVIFTGTTDYAVYFAVGFWLLTVMLLKEGLRSLKKVEIYGVFIIILIILSITLWYSPEVQYENLKFFNFNNFFLPFGVVLFAYLGFTSLPELRMEIKGNEKKLKTAIIIGVLIPIILYSMFSFIFIGVLGKNVPQVATLAFGKIVTLLGVFTLLTSYFVLNFSLKDVFKLDLKYSGKRIFLLTSLIPLFIYLVLYFFDKLDFVNILGIGGVISGGITGILILLMNKQAKIIGNRRPEYQVPINWLIVSVISLIFLLGIVVELSI